MFSAGLNSLQIHEVNRENPGQSSRQKQIVASTIIAASGAHILTSEYTTITLQMSTSYTYTIAFVAGLNNLQVN